MSPDLKVRRRKCNIVTGGEDDEMKMGLGWENRQP
jgi:hypothetical protein